MRLRHALNAAALACAAIASTHAQAELQTWHLTAKVYQTNGASTPAAGFDVGHTIAVDYVIDTLAPDFALVGDYAAAVTSFTINGVTSSSTGSVSATGSGFNAINVGPDAPRADGINFISFNLIGGGFHASVPEALAEFALLQGANFSTDLRVDFGTQSVWAKPVSFALAVPEPETWGLAIAGLLTVAAVRRARSAQA